MRWMKQQLSLQLAAVKRWLKRVAPPIFVLLKAVNQRRDVGVVGGHPYANVDGRVFHRVHGYGNGQREVGVAINGLVLSVQHINQEGRAVGLFVPAIQPAVAEQRVGADGTGHPRA